MISKIIEIKGLGKVFKDYKGDVSLPVFKRFNVIYGWNGSGKTTLSKLFDALNNPNILSGVQYAVEDDKGVRYKNSEKYPDSIRVFNRAFVERNIEMSSSKTKPIKILLGEENLELVEQTRKDSAVLAQLENQLKTYLSTKTTLDKQRGSHFTAIARTIGVAAVGTAFRNYIKTNAERDFASLKEKELLADVDLEKSEASAAQIALDSVDEVIIPSAQATAWNNDEFSAVIISISEYAGQLLEKTAHIEAIHRLIDNKDISEWVDDGYRLHNLHGSASCEYCQQRLPQERVEQLRKFFSDDDIKLKGDLDELITLIKNITAALGSIIFPERSGLYSDLQLRFGAIKEQATVLRDDLIRALQIIEKELAQKRQNTSIAMKLSVRPDAFDLIDALESIGSIVAEHNTKSRNFESVKVAAFDRLKKHHLSTIYDDVKSIDKEIVEIEEQVIAIQDGLKDKPESPCISDLRNRIYENTAKVSSSHNACEELNTLLAGFLGRNELSFTPSEQSITDPQGIKADVCTGYLISRSGEPATNLSESEETAIAFVYFVVHLKDNSFNRLKGIVVVDDPISSLDSNSIYQAFAIMKYAIEDVGQVFIMTHNFDYLKLVLNWLKNSMRNSYGCFMIKNEIRGAERCAVLDKMDKTLAEYESEYHYLYKMLKSLQTAQNGTIENAYPIPNIARKVLESFLVFIVPSGSQKLYSKIEVIKAEGMFDGPRIDALYKFVNQQSHITGQGFDPALVEETRTNVQTLLEFMQKVAPEHVKILDAAITK